MGIWEIHSLLQQHWEAHQIPTSEEQTPPVPSPLQMRTAADTSVAAPQRVWFAFRLNPGRLIKDVLLTGSPETD